MISLVRSKSERVAEFELARSYSLERSNTPAKRDTLSDNGRCSPNALHLMLMFLIRSETFLFSINFRTMKADRKIPFSIFVYPRAVWHLVDQVFTDRRWRANSCFQG